jgi:hypothetical protein
MDTDRKYLSLAFLKSSVRGNIFGAQCEADTYLKLATYPVERSRYSSKNALSSLVRKMYSSKTVLLEHNAKQILFLNWLLIP